jgi:nanoRNase/pAp phosphatase (c-di-AMP/oligoRNAs hydrolase)
MSLTSEVMKMDERTPPVRKNGKLFGQFKELVNAKLNENSKVALFSHPSPDPDAIGSQMGLGWLLKKVYDVDVDMFITGEISHPQNLTMEKLLGPKLVPISEYHPDQYDLKVLVDTIPSNAGPNLIFDVVIDHHLEMPQINNDGYLFINHQNGSCCGTIYALIKHYGVSFEEDVDYDQQVATAMMVGIYTDTCGMLGDRGTKEDRDAFNELFDFRDPEALKEIAKYKRPKSWISIKAAAANEAITEDGTAVVGLGIVSLKHRDLIADMADEMLRWEGVNMSIAFALVDGDTLQGSVRSMCASVSAAKFCRLLGEERGGHGWGHAAMGGYRYPLAGFALQRDEDEDTKAEAWKLLNRREMARITKLMKK